MRRSIDSRMDRIMARLLPPGSMERREYELPESLKETLQTHRSKTSAIISRYENREPGSSFEALLAGDLHLPQMPADLASALDIRPAPVLPVTSTLAEIEATWCRVRDGEY